MAGKLEDFSVRVNVAVNLAIRLFETAKGAEEAYRPSVGAAKWVPGEPDLWEEGNPGEPGYRRIWTIPAPANVKTKVVASPDFSSKGVADFDAINRAIYARNVELQRLEAEQRNGGIAMMGSGQDRHVLLPNVLCRKAHLRFNSHRVADECELELPLSALPLPADGSVIRSILAEARVGVIGADDWARALSEGAVDVDGRPLSMPVATDRDEPDFAGFVDDHVVHLPETGGSTARIKCRGMDGVLANEACRGRAIETDAEIDYAVARLLSVFPSMVGMAVHWLGPTLPPSLGDNGPTWKRRTTKKGKARPLSAKNLKQSVLDLITEACTLCGVTPRVVGYRLELAPCRTLDQYSAQTVPRMVLGHNLLDLELSHKMTGGHAKAIEVHSFNPDTGRICAGRWPHDPNRKGDLEPGTIHSAPPTGSLTLPPGTSAADEQSPEVMDVENVTNAQRLEDIARNAWEERARQDVSGKFSTHDVSTIEGRAQGVADLLSIRAGDPIAIVIAPDVEQASGSYLHRIAAMGRADAVAMLRSAGWSESAAEAVVDQVQVVKRPLIYRVREADLKINMDGPTELDAQVQNFIEVLDAEFLGNVGGNRARLPAGASFAAKWHAIDLDRAAGEIASDAEAHKQMVAAGAAERARRAQTRGKEAT